MENTFNFLGISKEAYTKELADRKNMENYKKKYNKDLRKEECFIIFQTNKYCEKLKKYSDNKINELWNEVFSKTLEIKTNGITDKDYKYYLFLKKISYFSFWEYGWLAGFHNIYQKCYKKIRRTYNLRKNSIIN